MNQRFPGDSRLKKSWEFKRIDKMGCKFHTPHFVLLLEKTSCTQSRLGVTVSKKVGNAVIRNRLKRQIREFFRTNLSCLNSYDFVIIAKRNASQISSSLIQNELSFLRTMNLD